MEEYVVDMVRVFQEQELEIEPFEIAAAVCEIMFDRGEITADEIDLCHMQAADMVRGAGYGA